MLPVSELKRQLRHDLQKRVVPAAVVHTRKNVCKQSREAVVARSRIAETRFNLPGHLISENLLDALSITAERYARALLTGSITGKPGFSNEGGPLHRAWHNVSGVFALSSHQDSRLGVSVSVFEFEHSFQHNAPNHRFHFVDRQLS